ncbi:receptor-like kinase TMK4 [Primulina tabacum]|uniref:receptor-like kinase TMK4 n=1 Tax=Primulina tabacum TaxID=48773 RepID=UPI003F5AC20C
MPKEKHKFPYKLLFILTSIAATIGHVSADDAQVMADFAKSISPTPQGWTGSNYCKWQGVNCDSSGKVSSINLSSKSLSGMIPSDLNQLSSLKSLSLQRNLFSGPLPPLSNLDSIQEVNLDDNNFDSIPQGFLSGLTSLQAFSVNNNSNLPPWRIPDTLEDSTTLVSFQASKANLVGEIPDIFTSLPNLQSLRLSYNNMSGSLPSSFAKSGMQNLWLNNQMMGFFGTIDVLGTMTQLAEVWLHVNKLSGPIPDLSACTELSDLQLRDNLLTGVIPDSLTKLPKLQEVSLQNNKFQGPVPSFPRGVQANIGTTNSFCSPTPGPCDPQVTILLEVAGAFGYPMTLAESWLGNDPCQNWKFISCDAKGTVVIINFAKQNLTGIISPAFSELTELKTLLLNDNNLDGTIPVSLTSLKQLRILDVSNNNLSGQIPSFSSSVTIKASGNIYIGKDLPSNSQGGSSSSNSGENIDSSSATNGVKSSASTVSPWMIIVPIIFLVIVISALGFVIYRRYSKMRTNRYKWVDKRSETGTNRKQMNYKFDKAKEKERSFSDSTSGTPIRNSGEKNDYQIYDGGNIIIPIDILREVTDNFGKDNIIGKGGFGIVYKGQLHDGTRIAVKRMESSLITDKGISEFKAEIEVLTKVRHKNLVSLHGFCDNGNERLLVYEYMPQGCLGQHLFEWKELESPPLTWNQRVTIALDVARGVEYLHSLAKQSFIHRDLKPSNVLLGDDMRAKVSDFGLVKSTPDGKYSLDTRLAGTFGYLAPEYAATGRVTTKVDVFAFGVVLMEMITGRKALDDSLPEDESQLVTWFRRLLRDKGAIKNALDPVLQSTIDEEDQESIWKVAELAGHCTARESYQRPDMSHAVNVLSPLVEQWQPVPDERENFGIDFKMSLPQVLQQWKDNETLSSDFYNGSTREYSSSSNSTGRMVKNSEFSSSFDGTAGGR